MKEIKCPCGLCNKADVCKYKDTITEFTQANILNEDTKLPDFVRVVVECTKMQGLVYKGYTGTSILTTK